jgi:hypothetical protein
LDGKKAKKVRKKPRKTLAKFLFVFAARKKEHL